MLNLGFKYETKKIQNTAIQWLENYFPSTLEDYIATLASLRARLHHCIAVVNLARRFDLASVLRVALYECTTLDLPQL